MSDAAHLSSVSVVIPIFNEAQNLPALLQCTDAACRQLGLCYEIILVDDGSRDGSTALLRAAAQAPGSRFVAVLLNRNYGQHPAILAGFSQARGEVIITLDADLQSPPEEIPRMVSIACEGYDIVGAIRANRRDGWPRQLASCAQNRLIHHVTGKSTADYGCVLRAYRRPIVTALLQSRESGIVPILANRLTERITDIEISHAPRKQGMSHFRTLYGLYRLYDLAATLMTAPLSVIGGLIALAGFCMGMGMLLLRGLLGQVWAGDGVFTLFAFLFTFIGAQLMALLGEYLGRIYQTLRARPAAVIQQVIGASPADRDEFMP
ncbi:Undecaprenyl-phosphate 4-deoxy-4-formamido-L-arabinose transferase [Sodalis glossinidius str. 'morsitans']|uniref:Glycosyltransferase n=1 Tax=Sodalis glossinidius (strain morsitans) TaxID=343509 RepID=Q2NWB0_SODGM|nr:glycosyltransferase [Sodalis glossinidius]BAE73565.1 putative glycosyltransferase [Sodalis glossinidius str. 'morsitans']CRL43940.1 Undecaprenyl-phosphate 4-deoxy-4-formamido-L-arabinose transferase [Sodalis glossinidius str. 'morsitans']